MTKVTRKSWTTTANAAANEENDLWRAAAYADKLCDSIDEILWLNVAGELKIQNSMTMLDEIESRIGSQDMICYRRFFNELAAKLVAIERLHQFESGEILASYLLNSRTQSLLGELYQAPDKFPGIEPITGETLDQRHIQAKLPTPKDDGESALYVNGRLYEIWMESLALCSCALFLLGRRNDEAWGRTLEISDEKTQGLPSGICAYRMSGDILRRRSRLQRERDVRINHGIADPYSIVIRAKEPLLFQEDTRYVDLTPHAYRRLGSTYLKLQWLTYLGVAASRRSEQEGGVDPLRIHYIVPSQNLDKSSISKWLPSSYLRRCGSESHLVEVYVLNDSDKENYVACCLSEDQGVYSMPTGDLPDIPYIMRKTTKDFHRSVKLSFNTFVKDPSRKVCVFDPEGKLEDQVVREDPTVRNRAVVQVDAPSVAGSGTS